MFFLILKNKEKFKIVGDEIFFLRRILFFYLVVLLFFKLIKVDFSCDCKVNSLLCWYCKCN